MACSPCKGKTARYIVYHDGILIALPYVKMHARVGILVREAKPKIYCVFALLPSTNLKLRSSCQFIGLPLRALYIENRHNILSLINIFLRLSCRVYGPSSIFRKSGRYIHRVSDDNI